MPSTRQLDRRTVLKGAGATALALSTAGCLDGLLLESGGATDDVVLDRPAGYDQLRDQRDEGAIPHPIHGDDLPAVTAPCALHGEDVTTTEFVGHRHTMYTFVFTRCPGACLMLTSRLVHVQVDAVKNEYADEVALLPVTFDPKHDTPDVLREYSEVRGAAVDDGNWHFLRPETEERAQAVVEDTFGIHYSRLSDDEREEMGMHEDMAFTHDEVIVLANADGYVERTYFGDGIPSQAGLLDDVRTLVERW